MVILKMAIYQYLTSQHSLNLSIMEIEPKVWNIILTLIVVPRLSDGFNKMFGEVKHEYRYY